MTDLSVIILVGREELHIRRCLERLRPLEPRQVFVVESQEGDRTGEIAREMGATTVWHDWPGLQSVQFNWALDHLPLAGEWIMRLDADEYLADDGVAWLKDRLSTVPNACNALELTLERKFFGRAIRHATNGIKMVRMFRKGHGRYGETAMDERIEFDGEARSVPVVFFDDNLNGMDWWRTKHRAYAKREAAQAIEGLRTGVWTDPRKATYYRLPPYLRAMAYFGIRYFLKGGCLDGYAGWMWNFWQGLWYRWIVDREIGRLRKKV